MARTTGCLFLLGGLLGVAITTQMPAGPGNLVIVYAAALSAVGFGAALLRWGDELSPGFHQLLIFVATCLITVAVHEATDNFAALSIATFYVLIACDAAFFFTVPAAALHLGFAIVSCLAVLGARPGLSWWAGLVTSGVVVAVGGVVAILGRLATEAEIDVLTGLPNRRGFEHLLATEISRAARTDSRPAVILLNLDRFAAINARHGHRAGDALLQNLATTWLDALAGAGVLARHGGDEFAVLLPDGDEQQAYRLAERLRAMVNTGCSAGVTSWRPGESPTLVISRADAALYRAKQTGRGRTVLESSNRSPLAVELLEAIAREQLDVYYQPIVSLDTGATVGVEALVRWNSTTMPGVTPHEVIKLAEDHHLIANLDRFVLHQACRDAFLLQEAGGIPELILNVNVSALDLVESSYVQRVDEVLRATGWPPGQLMLDVTESVLDVDAPSVVANMSELRARGIKIAIDDFGTGYSSLGRLRTLPTDFLKLDSSFVGAISPDTTPPPMLEVILLLSSALNLRVVAEGVETVHQAKVLGSLGYSLAEGHYYGKPRSQRELLGVFASAHTSTSASAESPLPRGATSS